MNNHLHSSKRFDPRVAAGIGALAAVLTYFNFFSVPNSSTTQAGCSKAGGTIVESRCDINGVRLEISN